MASAFNLTAQINIAGPSNIKPVVGKIQKQLKGIQANVDVKFDKRVVAQIRALNKNVNTLNSSISSLNRTAKLTGSGLNKMASSSASNRIANTSKSVQGLNRSLKSGSVALQNTNKQLAKSNNMMQAFGKHISLAAKKFAAFSLVTGVIYRVSNAIDVAVSEFVSFDRELVKISQVTGTSMKGLGSLEKTIRNLATSLGVSSQSLIKVSTTLAQAGLTATETRQALAALARADLAPTFGDMNETVEGSIALMRQFSISTKELETALGSINAVASQFAVESSDIITAIKRAGGVFAAASKGVAEGTDALNQFIAIFTSVRATTREGAETIATGLRTIFTRIQRGDTIEKLRAVGVELTDLEGKFVGPFEAIRRLSFALGGLDPRDARFAAIAEELGGFRQIGKVIPLLQQFSTAQAAYFVAQKGGNSLMKDATVAQQALAVQMQKTREQFVSMIASLANNQGLKNLATIALQAAEAILKITEAIGPAMPALAILLGGKVAKMGLGMITGKKFAAGGVVPGTGSGDTVPAMLTPGEFVIRKKAVGAIGVGNLQRMNKYALGGPVTMSGMELAGTYGSLRKKVQPDKEYTANVEPHPVPTNSVLKSMKARKRSQPQIMNWRNFEFAVAKKYGLKAVGGRSYLDYPSSSGEAKFLRPGATYATDAETGFVKGNNNETMLAKLIGQGKYRKGKKVHVYYPQNISQIQSQLKSENDGKKKKQRKRRATGGGISGSDTVPALLTPGEFVINKKAASRIGASKLHSMNRADKITGYNKGGFVGFAKGGKARKDAGIISQAQNINPKVMADVEAKLKSSSLAAEEVRAALVAFARSINKGEDIQTAKNKAIGAAGAQQQGVGHQSTRMAKKGIQQQSQFSQTGQGAPQADPTAVRQKAMASTGVQTGIAKQQIEGKFGAGTKASVTAMKVFKHELAATGSRTKAFSAALSAGQKHATVLSTGFAKLKTNAATFGQKLSTISMSVAKTTAKFSGLSLVATSFKNVFKGPIGALKKFGMAVNRASGGRLGKMSKGGSGSGMGGMMLGMAAEMAGGAAVSYAADQFKSGGDDTDASRMISGVGGGALTGAATGAMIGSMVPVIGTAVGAVVGGVVGAAAGYFSAQKEIANAQAQSIINAADKFTKRSGQALDKMSNMQLSAKDRATAEQDFIQYQKTDAGVQTDRKMSAMKKAGMGSSERAQNFAGEATQAVQYFATKAAQTGKSMDELKADINSGAKNHMDPQAYAQLERSILLADEGYQKTLDAHGNETVASGKARMEALKYARETSKTNAALYKNRMAIMAMSKTALSFKKAAEDMMGAMDSASRNFEYSMASADMILDPTNIAAPKTRSLDVINNAASSGAEKQAAYQNIAGKAFGSAGSTLAAQAALPDTLKETLSTTRANATGDTQQTATEMAAAARKAFEAAGIDSGQAAQAAEELEKKIQGMSDEELKNVDIGDLIKGDPKLTALLQGSEAVGKALKRYGEMSAQSLQQLAAVAQKTAQMEQAMRDRVATYAGERAANEDRMNAILGKGQTLQEKINRNNQTAAQQRSITTGVNESDPIAAAQALSDKVRTDTTVARVVSSTQDSGMLTDSSQVSGMQQSADAAARFGQSAATARQELEKIPGQLQGSIDAVLSELESVMQHRSAQINAASGLMEKALGSTPDGLVKLGRTMNLASAATQGFAPTIQQSEVAQKAYAKTIQGGGSQKQAQAAAQQAYAQQNQDTLGMIKELMPLMTAAGPEGKKEANMMMANAYESMLGAQMGGTQNIPPMFQKAIEMLRQDPGEDPQIAALQEQYRVLEEQKAQAVDIINRLDQDMIQQYRMEAANAIRDKLDEVKDAFIQNQAQTATEGEKTVASAGVSGGAVPTIPGTGAAGGAGAGGAGGAGAAAGAAGSGTGGAASGSAGSRSTTGQVPGGTGAPTGQRPGAPTRGGAPIPTASSGASGPTPARTPSRTQSTGPAPQAPAQNSGNGVNTNGLAQFTDKLNNLFDKLANVSIPSEINLTGAFDVNVKLNGAEVFKTMEPKIKEMILVATGEQINEFAGENFGGEGKTKKVPIGKSADQPQMA